MNTLDILNLLCKIAFLTYGWITMIRINKYIKHGLITMMRINAYIKQKGK